MSNEDKDLQQVAIQQLYTAIAKIEDVLGFEIECALCEKKAVYSDSSYSVCQYHISKPDSEDLLGRLNRAEKILKYQGEQLLAVTEMIDVIQTRKSGEALQEPKDLPAQERESLDEDPIL